MGNEVSERNLGGLWNAGIKFVVGDVLVAGAGPASHFRGASTTKSFTAAAIMLLDQRGQLRIDDVVTAPMPGSDKP